jgi:hypothetical protein
MGISESHRLTFREIFSGHRENNGCFDRILLQVSQNKSTRVYTSCPERQWKYRLIIVIFKRHVICVTPNDAYLHVPEVAHYYIIACIYDTTKIGNYYENNVNRCRV